MGMNSKPEMPEFSSSDEISQRDALEQILSSRFLSGGDNRGEVLRYLFDHRGERVNEAAIGQDVFDIQHVRRLDTGRVRKICGGLRRALISYADSHVSTSDWHIFLPPATHDGYQLRLVNLNAAMEADHKFWRVHLQRPRPIRIVYDEPLFYRDEVAGTVIRTPQVETGNEERALKDASQELKRLFRDEVVTPLEPCHLYTLAGEIGARDRIAEWFADHYGLKTEMRVSRLMRDIADLADCSAVVLGNVRTNKILQSITGLHQFKRFGYCVDVNGFRTVEVQGFTERERTALEKFGPHIEGGNLLIHDDPRPDKIVFCVVSRLPNPYDKQSAITMLSAGYTKVLDIVAETLTQMQYLSEAFADSGLDPAKPFPRYFQGLFSIRLGPTGTDDRPMRPVLRCCRFFDRFAEMGSQ